MLVTNPIPMVNILTVTFSGVYYLYNVHDYLFRHDWNSGWWNIQAWITSGDEKRLVMIPAWVISPWISNLNHIVRWYLYLVESRQNIIYQCWSNRFVVSPPCWHFSLFSVERHYFCFKLQSHMPVKAIMWPSLVVNLWPECHYPSMEWQDQMQQDYWRPLHFCKSELKLVCFTLTWAADRNHTTTSLCYWSWDSE